MSAKPSSTYSLIDGSKLVELVSAKYGYRRVAIVPGNHVSLYSTCFLVSRPNIHAFIQQHTFYTLIPNLSALFLVLT